MAFRQRTACRSDAEAGSASSQVGYHCGVHEGKKQSSDVRFSWIKAVKQYQKQCLNGGAETGLNYRHLNAHSLAVQVFSLSSIRAKPQPKNTPISKQEREGFILPAALPVADVNNLIPGTLS